MKKITSILKSKKRFLVKFNVAVLVGLFLCMSPMVTFAAGDEEKTDITSVDGDGGLIDKMKSAPETNNLAPATNMVTDTGLELVNFFKMAGIMVLVIGLIISLIKFGAGGQNTVGDGKSGMGRGFIALVGIGCIVGILTLAVSLGNSMFADEETTTTTTGSIATVYETNV